MHIGSASLFLIVDLLLKVLPCNRINSNKYNDLIITKTCIIPVSYIKIQNNNIRQVFTLTFQG